MRWSVFAGFFALGVVAAVLAARGGSARATDGTLSAAVGPGFSISLTQGGSAVTTLAPGTYTVNVSDMSTFHNFHLSGPGVDQSTDVDTTSSPTWTVTFSAGSYHFQCDAHPTMLHGDFTVGSSGGTTTAPTTTSPPTTSTTGTTTSPGTTTLVTTSAETTTTAPPATTTVAATPAPKLTARVLKLQATRSRILVTVKLNRPGQAAADLLDRHSKRVAHAATRVHSTAKLTLRPAHRLSPGRYALRLRITAAGRALVITRALRIA